MTSTDVGNITEVQMLRVDDHTVAGVVPSTGWVSTPTELKSPMESLLTGAQTAPGTPTTVVAMVITSS